MNRLKKRLVPFTALALLLCSYIFLTGTNAVDESDYLISQYGEKLEENLDQAYKNDEELMSMFSVNELGEPVYPDFIGGIYYNDDGNMVLQIVYDAASSNQDLFDAVQNFIDKKGIIVESVQFSQNEITATMNTLSALYQADNRPDALDNVDSIAEDTSGNRVEIRMRVFNEEEIARFKETVLDSPVLAFVQSSGPIVPATSPNNNLPNLIGGNTAGNLQTDTNSFAYWPWIAVLCVCLLIGTFFFVWRRQARPVHACIDGESVSAAVKGGRVGKKQIVAAIKNSDCVPRESLLVDILEKIDKEN